MIAVLQRVSSARVLVDGDTVGSIGTGLLVLAGFGLDDSAADGAILARKIRGIRLFPDDGGRMNLDVVEAGGQILAVSQFTLLGDMEKGRRPSFQGAAPADIARELMETFIQQLKQEGLHVETGRFQAHMEVTLTNDGPVTILLDSKTWRGKA